VALARRSCRREGERLIDERASLRPTARRSDATGLRDERFQSP
jgi:hypothetical protein